MLSKEQIAIIKAPADRHIKVVAVAGSGKSTTIRQRVSHLLTNLGVPSNRMLILMFNKSAQTEFATKLGNLNLKVTLPSTRTFHSMGSRLCQSLTKKGFLSPAELVEDSNKKQSCSLARLALKEVVGKTKLRSLQADNRGAQVALLEFIDLVKSSTKEAALAFDESGLEETFEPYVDCFHVFEQLRVKNNVRFFSDLIYDPVVALLSNQSAQEFVSNKMQQILVDEYQDINDISQELIRIVAGNTARVTVVGDDDQTIYEFRGSKPQYLISGFEESFEDPLTFTLSRTYRYGHSISLIANNVIRKNTDRFSKVCISDASTKPALVNLYQAPKGGGSLSEALETVVDPILKFRQKGIPLFNCAVLLRLFSSAPVIELAFMLRKTPYKLEGSGSVFRQEPFRTIRSIFSVCENAFSMGARETVLALLPHLCLFPTLAIKRDKVDQLKELFQTRPFHVESYLDELSDGLSKAARGRVLNRLVAIEWIMKNLDKPPAEFLSGYLEKSQAREIMKSFGGDDEDSDERVQALDAFLAFLRELNLSKFADLSAFLKQYDAICDTSTGCVLVTTVHRSKGLEWPVVVLPRLSETQFPHERKNQKTDIQSERRLFYVAVTRATKYLVLIVPSDEYLQRAISHKRSDIPLSIYGDPERASRFVYEANIAPAVALAKDIHGNNDYSSIEMLDDPEAFNEYLTAIGSDMTIAQTRPGAA